MKDAIITRTTSAGLDETCARLPEAAAKRKFGVLGTHDLQEKIRSKGLEFDTPCRVFEVCSPAQAQRILSGDLTVSAALPCRISVYVRDGRTTLATIAPESLLAMFGADSPEAQRIAREVQADVVAIMDETAGA